MASLSGQVPVHERVALQPVVTLHRRSDGSVGARDSLLLVPVHVVESATLRVRVVPGVSFPTGSFGEETGFVQLSTGSVDPWLGGDALVGGEWLAGFGVTSRLPVVAGTDGDRQGVYARANARVARRFGAGGAAWLGVSPVTALPSSSGGGDFSELAIIGGVTVPLGEAWALMPRLRVPAWQSAGTYAASVGLSVSTVFGGRDPGA